MAKAVFSFNRSFAAPGIPTSVSNLWSVDNTSTYRITELFYKYLSQQLPYYWAASNIIGKTDPLDYPRPIPWLFIAADLILLLLCFMAWRRSKPQMD